jgi:hypothetical protein
MILLTRGHPSFPILAHNPVSPLCGRSLLRCSPPKPQRAPLARLAPPTFRAATLRSNRSAMASPLTRARQSEEMEEKDNVNKIRKSANFGFRTMFSLGR